MAIICVICNKKQSSFIKDFPLDDKLMNLRICATCEERKTNVVRYALIDEGKYIENKEYLCDIIKNNILAEEVIQYLNNLIDTSDKIKKENDIEKEEKAEQIRTQQEVELCQKEIISTFPLTTGFNFEGYNIIEYKGIICAETVIGTGFLSEFAAGLSDIFGVESKSFELKLQKARDIALEKLILKAINLDSNAIIGIKFDYTIFNNNIIGIIINGTAVNIEKEK